MEMGKMNSAEEVKQAMQKIASPEIAKIMMRFFKTGEGQYGFGDKFIGIKVPLQREISKKFELSLNEIQKLLESPIHEHRLVALFILIRNYNKLRDEKSKKIIFDFYLKNTKYINNWDLIDLSAERIMGEYLLEKTAKEKEIIYKFAKSDSIWERRIAMLTTFQFIKEGKYEDSLKIAEILLNDKHDLIHKAVGWMLREIGKRDLKVEEEFLKKHYRKMPRTMLRYAIEKFNPKKREFYMRK